MSTPKRAPVSQPARRAARGAPSPLPPACLAGPHGAAVEHLAAADQRLGAWIARSGPCLLPAVQRPSAQALFDGLAHAIVGQQLSGKAADTIFGRVRALAAGEALTPADVLALDPASLRGAGLSGAKTASMKDLAERVLAGTLPLEELADLDDEAVVERLVLVRGIGRWTAQMALMFRLGRADVLPVADLGVRKGAMRLARSRELPDEVKLERLAKPWRPHRSVASWYLWRIAEAKEST